MSLEGVGGVGIPILLVFAALCGSPLQHHRRTTDAGGLSGSDRRLRASASSSAWSRREGPGMERRADAPVTPRCESG